VGQASQPDQVAREMDSSITTLLSQRRKNRNRYLNTEGKTPLPVKDVEGVTKEVRK
jgi:hypothetical protein